MIPYLCAGAGVVGGLIAGTFLTGQMGANTALASGQVIASAGGFLVVIVGAMAAAAGWASGQPLMWKRMHRVAYGEAYAGSFLDEYNPGSLTELGRVMLYRGAFADSPEFFFGGSATSGVLHGYLRMQAPEGLRVERSTLPKLLEVYLPISDEDWRVAMDDELDRQIAELEGVGRVEGFHGAAPSDARALKMRLIRSGQLENQLTKPKWRRYNDFAFWMFVGVAVCACALQAITGYSLSLEPEAIRKLIP